MADESGATFERTLAKFAYLLIVQIPDNATAVRELRRIRKDFRDNPVLRGLGTATARGAPPGTRKSTGWEALTLATIVDYGDLTPTEALKALERGTIHSNREWLRRRLKLGRRLLGELLRERPALAASVGEAARALPADRRRFRAFIRLRVLHVTEQL